MATWDTGQGVLVKNKVPFGLPVLGKPELSFGAKSETKMHMHYHNASWRECPLMKSQTEKKNFLTLPYTRQNYKEFLLPEVRL